MAYYFGKGQEKQPQAQATTSPMLAPRTPTGTQDVVSATALGVNVDPACIEGCRADRQNCIRGCEGRAEDPDCRGRCNEEFRKCKIDCEEPERTELACRNRKCVPVREGQGDEECMNSVAWADCGAECETDADCPEGQQCINGECVVTALYCCKKCIEGEIRQVQSATPCTPPISYSCDDPNDPQCGGACTSDEECQQQYGSNWRCVDGICKEFEYECETDADCKQYGEEYVCDNGVCKKIVTKRCTTDQECIDAWGEGYICKDGECVKEDGNGNGEGCEGGYKKPAGENCAFSYETKAFEGEAWCCPVEHPEIGEWEWPPEMQDAYEQLMAYFSELMGLGPYGGLGQFQLPDYLKDLFPQYAERAEGLLTPYELPEDIQNLMASLSGRAGEFLGKRPGYGEAAIQQMFGKGFEDIRAREQRMREQGSDWLKSQGLVGTGEGAGAMGDIAWQSEADITDLMRDIFLAGEEQKRADLYGYTGAAQDIVDRLSGLRFGEEQTSLGRLGEARGLTGQIGQMLFGEEAANMGRLGYGMDLKRMAQSIFGQGMDYNKIIEAINAARRGENQGALALIMQYLLGMGNLWSQ